MPLAKIMSAAIEDLSLVIVLLMTARSRSDPVSGAIVIVRSPLSQQRADHAAGEVVEAKGGGAEGVAHLAQRRT